MKLKDIKGKYTPIQIKIEDNKLFAQVAFLVDSPLFLHLLTRARLELKIHNPFSNLDEWHKFCITSAGFVLDEYLRMDQMKTNDPNKSKWLLKNQDNFQKIADRNSRLTSIVTKIRNQLNYPSIFDRPISEAIRTNKISSDFISVTSTLFYGNEIIEYDDQDTPRIAIFVSPYSTEKDLLKEYRSALNKYNHEYKIVPMSKALDKDTVSTIKRVRDWHWKQLNGQTYDEIVKDWNNKLNDDSPDYIFDTNKLEHAVSRYRKYLKTDT